MEVMTIKTEGPRADKPRRVHRVWLKTISTSSNGTTTEGHWIKGYTKTDEGMQPPQPHTIEVYLDRIGDVLKRTRTDKHREGRKLAETMAEEARREWVQEHRARVDACAPHERDAWIDLNCNLRPEHFYRLIPVLKGGYPPLEYCRVVHPRTYEEMDAFEFVKLDRAAQSAWLTDPPTTPETAGENATNAIAIAIERAFNRAGGDAAKNKQR